MDVFDIALTAQDSKKDALIYLVRKYHEGIGKLSVVATLDTGLFIKNATGIDMSLLSCGSGGGYLQMARLVNEGRLRVVIFLHDHMLSLNDTGIMELLQACNVQNIPFANNLTTAEFILHRFLEKEMATYWRCPEIRTDFDPMAPGRQPAGQSLKALSSAGSM
jgi:methylglyoxal synthase